MRTWATLGHTRRGETERKVVIICSWKIDDSRTETTLHSTVYDYLWYWRWSWKVSVILCSPSLNLSEPAETSDTPRGKIQISNNHKKATCLNSKKIHFKLKQGDRGGTVVKVLCYKSEGRWFDPSWCHWNFSLT